MLKRKTTEEYKKEVFDLVGYEYSILGEYVNNRTKIPTKHITCGHVYMTPPNSFLNGGRCMNCRKRWNHKNHDQFLSEAKALVGSRYIFTSEYTHSESSISIIHVYCGTEFETTPSEFLLKFSRCPLCSKGLSSGEFEIKEVLNSLGVSFINEKVFPSLAGRRFDFYLDEINTIIEFDGEQHFTDVPLWGGDTGLRNRMKADIEKTSFCFTNGIPILRIRFDHIWYTEELIKLFLEEVYRNS